MSRLKNFIAVHYKKLSAAILSAFIMLTTTIPAYASSSGGLGGSKIVTGTEKLIGDVTTWLMVLAPIVAGMLIIYFCIRRSAADEMDQKKWNCCSTERYCPNSPSASPICSTTSPKRQLGKPIRRGSGNFFRSLIIIRRYVYA